MSPRLNVSGVSLCVALAAAAILAAQDQGSSPQQPTFRTSIQSVRVDLYVTRDGKPVTDLRRDEIQLVEDGTPQAIQTFEQLTVAPHTAAEPALRTRDESRQSATDPRARLFVVFVPPRTSSAFAAPLMQARIPVLRQLNSLLGPDDLVAVVTPETPISELTFQRRLALNSDTWFDQTAADPRHALWDICYPTWIPGSPNAEMKARHRELMTFEALDALIAHLGGLREERKHVLLLSEGFRLYLRNPNLGAGMRAGTSGPQAPRRGTGPGPRADDPVGNSMISTKQCETDRIDLGSLDHAGRLGEIAAHARRNNVAFYPISPPGPSTPPGRRTFGGGGGGTFNNRTTSERQAGLRGLAEDTGGTAIINTSDIDGHLQKVIAGTASYYLLGYSSTNTALDGRFRRISVKVNRSNVQVRARPGYVALPPLDSRPMPVLDTRIAPTPVEHAMRTLAASRSSLLHVRSAAWTRGGSSGATAATLWIVGELDAQVQRRQSSAWTGELTLRPTRGGSSISRAITVPAGGSTFAVEWRESDGPLTAGEYSVQLQLTDTGGRPVGEFARVTIAEAQSALGEATLLRRGATTGQRYVRTADPRFVRTERLRLELPTDVPGAPSAIVRDSRGAELQIPAQIIERPDESGVFRWLVVDVPLTSLAPADYAVEVQHGGMTRVTAFRLIP
jgi:VWFA-related protein